MGEERAEGEAEVGRDPGSPEDLLEAQEDHGARARDLPHQDMVALPTHGIKDLHRRMHHLEDLVDQGEHLTSPVVHLGARAKDHQQVALVDHHGLKERDPPL